VKEKANVGVHFPYIRVVGIELDTQGPGRSSGVPLTAHEEEEFRHLAASPNIYETIARSVAPSIFGSSDIKKAIACLLIGGSRKKYVTSLELFVLIIIDDCSVLILIHNSYIN